MYLFDGNMQGRRFKQQQYFTSIFILFLCQYLNKFEGTDFYQIDTPNQILLLGVTVGGGQGIY